MHELQEQLNLAPQKDTVSKIAEEFSIFKELTFEMFKLLRTQISECMNQNDISETRHRENALLFLGIPELSFGTVSSLSSPSDQSARKHIIIISARRSHSAFGQKQLESSAASSPVPSDQISSIISDK
ncbi:hypothetical protein ACJJTC_004911 [Scirpophaga incertulas]